MLPSKAEVNLYATNRLKEFVDFAKDSFGFPSNYNVRLEILHKEKLQYSGLGGWKAGAFIKVNLYNVVHYQVQGFNEYPSIAKIRGLQSFRTDNWQHWVDALLLHELSHAIQYSLVMLRDKVISYNTANSSFCNYYFDNVGYFNKGHKDFFKRIYLILRQKFLNDSIKGNTTSEKIPEFVINKKEVKDENVIHPNFRKHHSLIGTVVVFPKHSKGVVAGYNTRGKKFPFLILLNDNRQIKTNEYTIMCNKVSA